MTVIDTGQVQYAQ